MTCVIPMGADGSYSSKMVLILRNRKFEFEFFSKNEIPLKIFHQKIIFVYISKILINFH